MTDPDTPLPDSPTIALALGGGAALGWAHIGVLRVLQEQGVAVGAVAGTSIGALAALCLAADRLDVLEEIALGASRTRILAYLDPNLGRGAWLGGRRIARELREHFGALQLEALPIPTAFIATDLDTAEEVPLTRGSAIDAVRASMGLPGLFQPTVIDGRSLIDGGMVANVPIAAARKLGGRLPLVAVNLMGDYRGYVATHPRRSAPATVRAAFLMMMAGQTRLAAALDPPDVLIAPAIGHISTGSFGRARELIDLGRSAALKAMPAIREALAAQKAGIS